jgi:hypothetical protein
MQAPRWVLIWRSHGKKKMAAAVVQRPTANWPVNSTVQCFGLKKKTEALRFYATIAAISSNGLFSFGIWP